jgi:hypothetical protein
MRSHHHALLTAALVAIAASAGAGQEQPFRTRGADDKARQFLAAALSASPTVRQLVIALEHTEVIVIVELCMVLPPSLGDTRLVSASPGVRHLRVRVATAATRRQQVAALGHELQHAVEIASAPEVRDTDTLQRLYERIGFSHWKRAVGGGWETRAAIQIERVVSSEVQHARVE